MKCKLLGTFDAISCSADNLQQLTAVISEVTRVLSDTGTYIIISYSPPPLRMHHFKRSALLVSHTEIWIKKEEFHNERESSYWFYCCTKQDSAANNNNVENTGTRTEDIQFITNPLCST